MLKNSYTYSHTDVYDKVATNPQGLTKEEAKIRLERDGKNAIQVRVCNSFGKRKKRRQDKILHRMR